MNFKDIELEALDEKGETTNIKLGDLKGKNIVLYFYPKDDTPVCTGEAIEFRDNLTKFPENTAVTGVSGDDIESHKHFFKKHELNFHILADTEHRLAEAFSNVANRTTKEGKSDYVMRSTFVIDKNGKIIKEWRNVSVDGHIDEILAFLKTLK